jgi:hypothetical protein
MRITGKQSTKTINLVGRQIKVIPTHWARPHETGTILHELPKGRYEILFDRVGVGFDGGNIMILGEADFQLLVEDT